MMEKTLFAIEPETNTAIAVTFSYKDCNLDLHSAVKAAALEFIQTPEGSQIYQHNCQAFNWGDFVNEAPSELCQRHGFTISSVVNADELVSLNEQLICD